ncbi:RHS repeat-associated core domain-containing protein [Streptomyces sp. NBC_00083]|uniref:RHS repeat-associated core domain-containing protein n=1 Tax=Streptomyces sp. NBC_00083 TaxID=2975647 RepID=UPI002258DEB9|nr:RHS repeat-associated core domain-containing protein [Streptomyces sp. NBC_00083]MCX5387499.1 hypothetical protein [Streptomyces sp. NBC_00083]
MRHLVHRQLLDKARESGPDVVAGAVRTVLADDAVARGADAVLCTCSTIGGAVAEAASSPLGVPVLRVNRRMVAATAAHGRRIAVAATVESTLDPTARLIREEEAACELGGVGSVGGAVGEAGPVPGQDTVRRGTAKDADPRRRSCPRRTIGFRRGSGPRGPGSAPPHEDFHANELAGYDAVGNTTSVATTGTGDSTTSSTYNPSTPTCGGFTGQRCTIKDARGKVTSFTYDDHGNLTKSAPPAPQGATTATYDALGRPRTVTDGRGVTSTYTYDNLDQVCKVTTSGGLTVSYVYDLDGNLTQRTDQTGTVKHAYDGLGRETVRTLQDNSQSVLTYTPDGDVDTYQDPAGTTDYTWDDADRLHTLKAPDGQTTTYDYDANDHRTTTTYPGNTVQSVTLDADGKPKAIKATSPKGTLVDLAYSYTYRPAGASADKNGVKIYTRTDNLDATHRKTTYTYDSAGRLSAAQDTHSSGGDTSWVHYCLDEAGNLLARPTSPPPTCPAIGLGYNDPGQLVTRGGSPAGWSYDANGNETAANPGDGPARTNEAWNDFGQQTSITAGSTTYPIENADTGNTERIRIGDTWFHQTQTGLAASTTGDEDTGFVREPAGTLNSMTRDGKSYYYLTDATGNVLGLTDSAGTRVNSYTYTPTGQARTTTEQTPQPYRYAGTYLDPTGLYKMGARSYDPNLARFTTTDPSGQETNPYLYAAGDPVNNSDPTGLSFWSSVRKIGFASIGGAIGGAVTGAIAGCVVGAEIGCLPTALVGAFGGGTAGAATKGYLEYQGQ